MPHSRKKTMLIAILVTLGVLLILFTVVSYRIYRNELRRFYAYAPYANAWFHYVDLRGRPPATLADLEAEYTALASRDSDLPPAAPFGRPDFRPCEGLPDDDYLIIVEPETDTWLVLTRMLLYAHPDGTGLHMEQEYRWRVNDRITADDEKRQRANTHKSRE